MVGASYGGWESLLLADREPTKVVGMVFVDGSFPEQQQRQDRVYSPALRAWDNSHAPPFIPIWQRCVNALRAGTLRRGDADPDRCFTDPRPPSFPPELIAALDKAALEQTPDMRASKMEALLHGAELNGVNSKVTINPKRTFGAMPSIILIPDHSTGLPGIPAELQPDAALMVGVGREAAGELAALSTQGEIRVIQDATHDIAASKPQAVIDAIDQVVDETRTFDRLSR